MEDIKVTEGTILESLNNKADIDGGNYKGSGLQAVLEKTTLGTAGGTVTGSLEVINGFYTKYIEFTNATSGNGGYIDFHFNGGETDDYTSRIIENSSGQISVVATNGFNFPKCTTKATTTSSASASKVAVITQNYKSGTSWYRVWSDGWIEQGGCTSSITSDALQTVTFTKAFTAVPYVNPICRETVGETGEISTHLGSVTTKNFTCKIRRLSGSGTDGGVINWYACGY